MGQQCAGHARDVARRRVVAGIVGQPRAVEKLRVFHAQFFRAVVHALGERLLGTGDVLCHGDGAVIGGVDGDALEHLVDAHLLALLEPDLAAAHGAGMGAGGHDVARIELAAVELLHDEQQRHDLRHAGGGQVLIGIFLIQHRAGRALHQDRRRCGYLQLFVRWLLERHRGCEQQQRCQQQTDPSFHMLSPFR